MAVENGLLQLHWNISCESLSQQLDFSLGRRNGKIEISCRILHVSFCHYHQFECVGVMI